MNDSNPQCLKGQSITRSCDLQYLFDVLLSLAAVTPTSGAGSCNSFISTELCDRKDEMLKLVA